MTLKCPINDTEIAPGEGVPLEDTRGNLWIVSSAAASVGVGPDVLSCLRVKPVMGPDA
jgi:hypothetical protein